MKSLHSGKEVDILLTAQSLSQDAGVAVLGCGFLPDKSSDLERCQDVLVC